MAVQVNEILPGTHFPDIINSHITLVKAHLDVLVTPIVFLPTVDLWQCHSSSMQKLLMMPLSCYVTPFPIWKICKTSCTSSGYNFSI